MTDAVVIEGFRGPPRPATAADLQAAEMWRLAEALPPDLRAAFVRANAVLNMVTTYRAALLSPDPEMAKLRGTAVARIDAAWEALAGQGVTEASRVALMRAVDAAVKAGGGVDAVLAELPSELVALLGPHRDAIGALVTAWPRTTAGRGRGSKWAACAALWRAATGEATAQDAWRKLWSRSRWSRPR